MKKYINKTVKIQSFVVCDRGIINGNDYIHSGCAYSGNILLSTQAVYAREISLLYTQRLLYTREVFLLYTQPLCI